MSRRVGSAPSIDPERPTFPAAPTVSGRVGAWILVALIAGATLATFVIPTRAPLARASVWGGVLLVSTAGWGRLIERLAFPQHRADVGLRMAWGAAGLIFLGGLVCSVSLATRSVLLALVLGGVFLSLAYAVRSRAEPKSAGGDGSRVWPAGAVVALSLVAVLVGVQYLAGAAGSNLNVNDDHIAYLVFPKKILATGSLIEPFSLRRMTAYGGQSFLLALALLGSASPMQAPLLDFGLSLVVVLSLILGAADRRTPRELLLLPVLFVVSLENLRANTASEMSGVVFFLALFRTARWSGFKERPLAGAVTLSLVAAAGCTLRQSYLLPIGLFLTIFYLPTVIVALRMRASEGGPRVGPVGTATGALLLFLLPWALLSHRSNHTFLFPLISGNYRPAFRLLIDQANLDERIRLFWENICHGSPVHSLPFFLLAGMAIPWRKTDGALPALMWASLFGFLATVFSLPFTDESNIARYYYAFEVAMVLAAMLAAFSLPWTFSAGSDRARAAIPAVLAAVALGLQLQQVAGTVHTDYLRMGSRILAADSQPSSLADGGDGYLKLQASIPAGAPILAMLDAPFWLDFRRNRIDLVDLPGAASPAPGMPLDDDEALVRYLGGLGYRYVAFVRSSRSHGLYRREALTNLLRGSPNPQVVATVPFFLRMFDRFESLAKSRRILYDDGGMVALDLTSIVRT